MDDFEALKTETPFDVVCASMDDQYALEEAERELPPTFYPTPRPLTLADVVEELERLGVNDLTSVVIATQAGPVLFADSEFDIERRQGVMTVTFGTDYGNA